MTAFSAFFNIRLRLWMQLLLYVFVAVAVDGYIDDGLGGSIETDGICKEKRN